MSSSTRQGEVHHSHFNGQAKKERIDKCGRASISVIGSVDEQLRKVVSIRLKYERTERRSVHMVGFIPSATYKLSNLHKVGIRLKHEPHLVSSLETCSQPRRPSGCQALSEGPHGFLTSPIYKQSCISLV